MSSSAIAANIVAWTIQTAIVVAIASVALWAARVRTAGVTYTFWRAVAVLCLVLPWIQPYQRRTSSTTAAFVFDAAAGVTGRSTAPALSNSHLGVATIALVVLAGGALLRLTWLVVGVVKLRHLRRAGTEGAAPMGEDLQRTLGTRADIRYVPSLEHPVTFGLAKPIVLLPNAVRFQSADVQRAVAGHELIHVRRRDWFWLLVEEIGVSLMWFHPAAWWLASRIQLAREEVVDELTILLTGRRKAYVEALLAFSDSTSVVPTAAFARRRHLIRRIALISTEDSMSSKRIVFSCAVMALVVVGGAWRAVAAFPLRAGTVQMTQLAAGPGPLELRAHGVTPENPVPRRVHYEAPTVPDIVETSSAKITLKITVDDAGGVAEARPTAIAVRGADFTISVEDGDLHDLHAMIDKQMSAYSAQRIMPPDVAWKARKTVTAVIDSAMTSVKAWRYDPPAQAPLTFAVSLVYGDPGSLPASNGEKALRIGGGIEPPKKIVDVRPVYPPEARAAGIKGVVILEARIDAEGNVEDARVLKSVDTQIDQAAIDAVRQWKFTPTLMNGEPTAVIMTVTINFTLE